MWPSQSTFLLRVDSDGFDQIDRNHLGEREGTIAQRKRVLFDHQVKLKFLSGNVPWTFREISENKKTSTYFVIWLKIRALLITKFLAGIRRSFRRKQTKTAHRVYTQRFHKKVNEHGGLFYWTPFVSHIKLISLKREHLPWLASRLARTTLSLLRLRIRVFIALVTMLEKGESQNNTPTRSFQRSFHSERRQENQRP